MLLLCLSLCLFCPLLRLPMTLLLVCLRLVTLLAFANVSNFHDKIPSFFDNYIYKLKIFTERHFISSQFRNFDGCGDTTDDIATIPLRFHICPVFHRPQGISKPLSCPFLWSCLPISSSVFLSSLFLSLFPEELSSPCQRILRCVHTIWISASLPSCTPIATCIPLQTSSFATWSL